MTDIYSPPVAEDASSREARLKGAKKVSFIAANEKGDNLHKFAK